MKQTALLITDMQNDFLHQDGAYARGGKTSEQLSALPKLLASVANVIRKNGGWVVSTHFTLVPGIGGEPIISDHLKELRPFLCKGDFTTGSFVFI